MLRNAIVPKFLVVCCGLGLAASESVFAQDALTQNANEAARKQIVVEFGLDEALRVAAETSKDLAKNNLDLKLVDAQAKSARASFLPTLRASSVAGTTHIPENPDPYLNSGQTLPDTRGENTGDVNFYQIEATLTQNLFAGFSQVALWDGVSLQRQLQEVARENILRSLAQNVFEAYLKHLYLREQLDASQQVLVLRRKRLAEISVRERVGRSTALDFMQAQLDINQQEVELLQLQSDIDKSNSDIMRLLGQPINRIFSPKDNLQIIFTSSGPLPPLDEAYTKIINKHPALQEVALNIRIAELQYQSQNGHNLPSVDFTLGVVNKANRRADVGATNRTNYSGQVKVEIPIFTGLSSFAEKEQYIVRKESLAIERQQRLDTLFKQLETVYEDFRVADATLARDEANVKLADASTQRAELLFNAGRASNNDVLEQYTRKLKALYQLAGTRYKRALAKASGKILIQGVYL